MKNLDRRSVVAGTIAGTVAIGAGILSASPADDEARVTKLWTLEGQLKVHPKFVYRYYLVLLDGQKCPLYGAGHSEPEQLANLQLPVRVRVRGTLGTRHHTGGTKDNPSPFPKGWWVYMDVHEVDVLK